MKILLTGHAGFVGRHLAAALEADHEVIGVDLATGLDARDHFRTDTTHVDLVLHCAAIVEGRHTIEGHPLKVAVDLAIDAELFQWALRTRPGRIVYYSSSAAYPAALQERGRRHRLAETDLDPACFTGMPDLTYGWAKLTGELLAQYAQADGLKVLVLRPFSGYGTDQSLDYPFPSFIARAAARKDPFLIWGDGTQTRDFIHIDDVVGATLAAVRDEVQGPVNLGWGRPTSFNDLAQLVCTQVGYQPRFHHLVDMPQGVHYRVADPSRLLGFYQPTVTLEDGIARALA